MEVTDEAVEMLARSLELGGVDKRTGGVRLRAARTLGGDISLQVELTDGPSDGEEIIEKDGVRIFVDSTVVEAYPNAVVVLDPEHDRIAIRATGEQR
jgi:Fe-S cluster assembly iron-binding protein IscA